MTKAGQEGSWQLTLPRYYRSLCELTFNIFTEKTKSLFFQLIPASGLKKRADRAKARKTIPPMIVTKEGKIETLLQDEQKKNPHAPGMFLNSHLF